MTKTHLPMKKILNVKDLKTEINKIRKSGSIVLTGGCFDILHEGHKVFLERAKKQADILIVLLESDTSVKRRKGDARPINTQKVRSQILATINSVDFIILLPDFKANDDYYKMTKLIRPDIIAVTKNDPFLSIKQDQAKIVGGKVVEVVKLIPNKSTSLLINNLQT